MSGIGNEELIELASLQRKIDHQPCSEKEIDAFERKLAQLTSHDFIVMTLAVKLLEGNPYSVTTDNPDTVRRCRALADRMGATVEEFRDGGSISQIIFHPAARQ